MPKINYSASNYTKRRFTFHVGGVLIHLLQSNRILIETMVLSSKLTLTGSLRSLPVSLRIDVSVTIGQAEARFLLVFPNLHRNLNRLDQYI